MDYKIKSISLILTMLIAASALFASAAIAGTSDEPEITDPSGDAVIGEFPAATPVNSADIVAAWMNDDGENLSTTIQLFAMDSDPTAPEFFFLFELLHIRVIVYEFHFTVDETACWTRATYQLSEPSPPDVPGSAYTWESSAGTANGVVDDANNTLTIIVPLEDLGVSVGDIATELYVTSAAYLLMTDLSPVAEDRAPDADFGEDYTIGGAGGVPTPEITLSCSSKSKNVAPGANVTYAMVIYNTGGTEHAVTLAYAGLPSGWTATFDGGSATATITVPAQAGSTPGYKTANLTVGAPATAAVGEAAAVNVTATYVVSSVSHSSSALLTSKVVAAGDDTPPGDDDDDGAGGEGITGKMNDFAETLGLGGVADQIGLEPWILLLLLILLIVILLIIIIILLLKGKKAIRIYALEKLHEVDPGEIAEFQITVQNQCKQKPNGKNRLIIGLERIGDLPSGWKAEMNKGSFDLDGGESGELKLTVKTSPSASMDEWANITVKATPQEKPKKAAAVATITMIKEHKPDLVITNVTHAPVSFKGGDVVTTSATVENNGDAPAENIAVVFYVDGEERGRLGNLNLVPGAKAKVKFPWKAGEGENHINMKVEGV